MRTVLWHYLNISVRIVARFRKFSFFLHPKSRHVNTADQQNSQNFYQVFQYQWLLHLRAVRHLRALHALPEGVADYNEQVLESP